MSALRGAGLSNAKTVALLDLAAKVADGSVPLDAIGDLDDDEIVARLTTVRGIGRWTAEMFLLFELERPDVWPVDDLGVRNGWRLIHGEAELLKPRALQAEGDRFRPYRSVVALLCWHAVHVERGRRPGLARRPRRAPAADLLDRECEDVRERGVPVLRIAIAERRR